MEKSDYTDYADFERGVHDVGQLNGSIVFNGCQG
jgi:hypothetical protein